MKSVLILFILYSIILTETGGLKRNLESLTEKSEDKNKKPFSFSKYSNSLGSSNGIYEQNRAVSGDARIYGHHKRYRHRYRYYKSLNPSFQRRLLPARKAHVLKLRNMPYRTLDPYNADANGLSFNHQDFSVKSQKSRRDKNNNYAHIPEKDTRVAKAINNERISDKINIAGSNPQNDETRYSDKTYPEEKRDVAKKGRPKEKSQKSFGKFSSLQLLGLLLMFVPTASIILSIVVSITTFCWSKFKQPNRKEDTEQNDPEATVVETAIVNKSQPKIKQSKESESYQDIVRNFVSNDIDGKGDTVAKDMKLERWMMQGLPPRPLPRSKYNNNYLADMESVAEENSEIESTFDDRNQPLISPAESEDPMEELMPLSGRKKKCGRVGETSKANRHDSHPFPFPDVGVTIGRVINPRYPRHTDTRHANPRNLFSLIHQPSHFGKPTTQSMVEMIPLVPANRKMSNT